MSRRDLLAGAATATEGVSGESSTGGPMANPDSRESTNEPAVPLVAPLGAATDLGRAEERWAERDRQRAETEAFYEEQRSKLNAEYVRVVAEALHADSDHGTDGWPLDVNGPKRGMCNCVHKAAVAVAALMVEGYVFVRQAQP